MGGHGSDGVVGVKHEVRVGQRQRGVDPLEQQLRPAREQHLQRSETDPKKDLDPLIGSGPKSDLRGLLKEFRPVETFLPNKILKLALDPKIPSPFW